MASIKRSNEEEIFALAKDLFDLKLEETRYSNSQNITKTSPKKDNTMDNVTHYMDKLSKKEFVLNMIQEKTNSTNMEIKNTQKPMSHEHTNKFPTKPEKSL